MRIFKPVSINCCTRLSTISPSMRIKLVVFGVQDSYATSSATRQQYHKAKIRTLYLVHFPRWAQLHILEEHLLPPCITHALPILYPLFDIP